VSPILFLLYTEPIYRLGNPQGRFGYAGDTAFLTRYAETLEKMNETELGGHKTSLIVRRLEKLRNLVQESTRHWSQIMNEYYDFELLEFLNQRLNPAFGQRAPLSIHLQAQGKAEGVDNRQ
jgi:insulysin